MVDGVDVVDVALVVATVHTQGAKSVATMGTKPLAAETSTIRRTSLTTPAPVTRHLSIVKTTTKTTGIWILEQLSMHEHYDNRDQVQVANGASLYISQRPCHPIDVCKVDEWQQSFNVWW